jgi:hypothetical protein
MGLNAMREVHCPHCHAINRLPRCGSCKKEIDDPPAIAVVWNLYEHRKVVGMAFLIVAIAFVLWRPWEVYFFSPANITDCREQAARTARSKDALRVLEGVCYDKFPSKP